jgi:gas vesicle protein
MRRDELEEDEDEVGESGRSVGVGTFLAGLAIGAGLALLLTPQSGPELRRKIRRTARRAQHAAEDLAADVKVKARDIATEARHRAGELVTEARHELDNRVDEARHALGRRKRELSRAVDAGKLAARDARESFERRIAEVRNEEARGD